MILFDSNEINFNKLKFITYNYCLNSNWREISMNSKFKDLEKNLFLKIKNDKIISMYEMLLLNISIKNSDKINKEIILILNENLKNEKNSIKLSLIIDILIFYFEINNEEILNFLNDIVDLRILMNCYLKNLIELLNQNNYDTFYKYINFLYYLNKETNIDYFYLPDWKLCINIILKELENQFNFTESKILFELFNLLLKDEKYNLGEEDNNLLIDRIKDLALNVKDDKLKLLKNILEDFEDE